MVAQVGGVEQIGGGARGPNRCAADDPNRWRVIAARGSDEPSIWAKIPPRLTVFVKPPEEVAPALPHEVSKNPAHLRPFLQLRRGWIVPQMGPRTDENSDRPVRPARRQRDSCAFKPVAHNRTGASAATALKRDRPFFAFVATDQRPRP